MVFKIVLAIFHSFNDDKTICLCLPLYMYLYLSMFATLHVFIKKKTTSGPEVLDWYLFCYPVFQKYSARQRAQRLPITLEIAPLSSNTLQNRRIM